MKNKLIKVLFLSNNLGSGGAERVLVNLANNMANDGYEITVRTLADSGENRSAIFNKVKYEYVFKKSFRGMNYLHLLPHRLIYNKVAGGDYDVIVVYLHGVLTKIVSYAPRTQNTIAYLHANMERSPFIKSFKSRAAIQKCFAGYDRIVSVSQDVQDSFIRVSGICDDRLVVKYNTFDVEKIQRQAEESIDVDISESEAVLCSVGKLEHVKGYDRLLVSVNRLVKEGFKLRLLLVGEGAQRSELESYIRNNGLNKYVTLTGFDINPYKYIKRCDLFVCSSYSEGFSSVVAESLILGTPVLTTDCAGMKEMLGEHNEYGVIVENSEEGIYEGLKRMLSDSNALCRYRKSAEQRSGFFMPEQTTGAVEQMIEEVVRDCPFARTSRQ